MTTPSNGRTRLTDHWDRLDATARYAVLGHPGVWRYVGQASFADDDGADVEHDWVRMVPVGRAGQEAWVAPGDVARLADTVDRPLTGS